MPPSNPMPSPNMDDVMMGNEGGFNDQEPPMNNDDDLMGDNEGSMEMGGDEENSPKNEIQKLTGKLSQKLNDYITKNQNDSELSKYVINMIAKQASKNLSDEDKSEVIDKIENGDESYDFEPNDMQSDDGLNSDALGDDMPPIKNESINEPMKGNDNSEREIKQKNKLNKKSPFNVSR